MKDIENMLKDGILVEGIGKVKVKLVGLIADAPAFAKVLNCMRKAKEYQIKLNKKKIDEEK